MTHLTLRDIEFRRTQSGRPSSMGEAHSSSKSFNLFHQAGQPKAKVISHHFSIESVGFTGSDFKKAADEASLCTAIPLGTGRPSANFYPWERMVLHESSPRQSSNSYSNSDAEIQKIVTKYEGPFNLATALNYGGAAGSPQLMHFVTDHIELVHNPPYKDWGICLTSGSTSALEITLRLLCNRGDTILVEQFTYPGFLALTDLLGVSTYGIGMDADGLRHDLLKQTLQEWDISRGLKPRVLYMIPSGQNPTGTTQSKGRRRAIYEIAEESDLIIIEDDPYYFLHLGASNYSHEHRVNFKAEAYLSKLLPSYLSLDRSGRVIRLDSVSKILAPGLRAGWVTANAEVINKFIAYSEVSRGAVSGPAQIMLFELLDRNWGHQGFFQRLDALSLQYYVRLKILSRSCIELLPKNVCSWTNPSNGMFLWVTLNLRMHPFYRTRIENRNDVQDLNNSATEIETRIASKALDNGVTVIKGSVFTRRNYPIKDQIYFRLTFAAVVNNFELHKGIIRFSNVLKSEFITE